MLFNTVSGLQFFFLDLSFIRSRTVQTVSWKSAICVICYAETRKDSQKQGDKFPLQATAGKATAFLHFQKLTENWWTWISHTPIRLGWNISEVIFPSLWIQRQCIYTCCMCKLHVDWLDMTSVSYSASKMHVWLNNLGLWHWVVSFPILAIMKNPHEMGAFLQLWVYAHSHAAKRGGCVPVRGSKKRCT